MDPKTIAVFVLVLVLCAQVAVSKFAPEQTLVVGILGALAQSVTASVLTKKETDGEVQKPEGE